MLAVRLPSDIERRLERLAHRTGRTKTFMPARPSSDTWTNWTTSTSLQTGFRSQPSVGRSKS
jgi:predicted transcriptional regulator